MPDEGPNEFFILSQEEANQLAAQELERIKDYRTKGGRSLKNVEKMPGLSWSVAQASKDEWNKLPK